MLTRLLLMGLLIASAPARPDAGDSAGLEKMLREALKVSVDMPVGYAAVDGKPLSAEQFSSEMRKGSVNVVPDYDLQPGKAVFRLARPAAPETGPARMPALDASTLDGRRIRTADIAGKPTLLTFFFSTCVPCIQEVPALNEFRRRNPGMNFLAITFDPAGEARGFVEQRKLDWPVIADARAFIDAAEVRGYPAYLLVAADGRIVARHTGLVLGVAEATPGLASLEKWVTEAQAKAP